MDLPNPKELKVLLKLLRSQGVTEFNCPAMQVKLGEMPYEIKGGERVITQEEDELPAVPTDAEMAFYSAPDYVNEDPLEKRMKEQQ